MNMFDYWLWEKNISINEIQKINKKINQFKLEDIDNTSNVSKIVDVKIINYNIIENYLKPYVNNILNVNEHYFGYDLYPLSYAKCNYNIYKKNSQYDWHVDESLNSYHDIKLTALFNLSEKKYKGGDFKLFKGCEINIENFNNPGDILLFKSHLNHKVMPVIEGVRKTLTVFLKGPKFK